MRGSFISVFKMIKTGLYEVRFYLENPMLEIYNIPIVQQSQ